MTQPYVAPPYNPSMRVDPGQYSALVEAVSRTWGSDVGEAQATKWGLRYQYWRKCMRDNCRRHTDKYSGKITEKGWICIGPSISAPLEHAEWINSKHMTPLPQYGEAGTGEGSPMMVKATRWNQILERGGIMEFPRDQMIAYGWDKLPIIRQYRPDLEGVERVSCPYGCTGRDFPADEVEAFRSHVKVAHPTVEGPEATARAMQGVMEKFTEAKVSLDPNLIAQVVAATVAALEQAREQSSLAKSGLYEDERGGAQIAPELTPVIDDWLDGPKQRSAPNGGFKTATKTAIKRPVGRPRKTPIGPA